MERRRVIPQALLLLLLMCGAVVSQTRAPRLSPSKEAKVRDHHLVDDNPAPRPLAPRVVSGSPPNQENLPLTPAIQNPEERPPAPLPPSQMPPSPPRISYAGGKLTVVASNSILDDVLTEVAKAIGADVQRSVPSGNERVFGQFGPASPSEVLNTLLRGSRYDFVVVGSADGPDLVRQIILTPSSSGAAESAQAAPVQPPPQGLNPVNPAPLINRQRAASQSQEEQGFPPGPGHPGPGARRIFRNPGTIANPNVPQQLPAPPLQQPD